LFKNGDEKYVAIPILIPSSTPSTKGWWFQVAELYGAPYGGSPPIGIFVDADSTGKNHLSLRRDATHNHDQVWLGPLLDGLWHTVILHVRFATDNSGFVQIWYDGVPQHFNNGATQLNYITLEPGINWDGSRPNFLNINSYREGGAFPGLITIYHGTPAVGDTFASVSSVVGGAGHGP
jgi:hypothetical protein